ncbi:MAG: glycosyltransferase [Planctomycetota bacterium]|jgi:glycosyltransferase involved in cell wall biosynthesis
MRISIVTSFFPPDRIAGAELGAYFMARGLSERGHDVHVIVTRKGKTPSGTEKRESFKVHWMPFLDVRGLRFISELFFAILALLRIRPDIIHGQCLLPSGFIASLVGLLMRRPSVLYLYGQDVTHIQPYFRATFGRFAIKYGCHVMAQAKHTRDVAMKTYDKRPIKVFYSGIDLDRFKIPDKNWRGELKLPEKGINVLFIGRFLVIKNIDILINAVAEARKEIPDLNLLIVGTGDMEAALHQQAASLGMSEVTYFLGAVPNSEVAKYYASADIFVLPSRSESFGLVNIEAMAMGLPVISTTVMGIPEVIKDGVNGYLVPPGDVRALADKIRLLAGDEKERKKFSDINKKDALRFNWETIIPKLEKLYVALVVNGPFRASPGANNPGELENRYAG